MLKYMLFCTSLFIYTSFAVAQSKADELYQAANQAYDNRNFAEAGDLFAKSFEADPDGKNANYASFNASCAYSLAKDKKKAIQYAKIAYDKGMLNFEEDKDFDNIRNTRRFKKLVKASNAEIDKLKSVIAQMPITYVPSGYDKDEKAPLIVLLHGYGSNPANFIEVYKPLAESKNAILVACRGSEILSRNSFYWDYENEQAKKKIRRDIEQVAGRFNVNKEKIILTGFSQGGYLCFDFGLKNADMFKGIMPVAGVVPNDLKLSDIAKKDLKLFAFVGLKESEKLLSSYDDLDKQLDHLKIPYYLHFSNVGHEYPENRDAMLSEAFDWLMK